MIYYKYGEYQYLNLLKDILKNGEIRKTRNATTISDFCKHLKFDLRAGFPLKRCLQKELLKNYCF